MRLYCLFCGLLLVGYSKVNCQNLGGKSTYNFLKLASAPQISALGGTVIAIINEDVNLAQSNPALLNRQHDNKLAVNANFLYGGIQQLQANYSKGMERFKATGNLSVHFVNYGSTPLTDASGNILGNFRANDYAVQFSFSKKYLEKWSFGNTIKFIRSNYGSNSSSALAMDLGLSFYDSANLLKAGLVFKNIGFVLQKFPNGTTEALPFDFQMGFSKKLEKAPLQFIFTVTNLHQFDIRYADTLFENEMNGTVQQGKFTIDKLFRHLIFGAQVYPSKQLELTIAYNYLRRKELGLFTIGSGVTGFSFGAGALFNNYQIRYAKSFYQNNKAYNQFGITINFNRLIL